MAERADVAIVGAGIVGLATARALLRDYARLHLTVVDKEPKVAAHQTGHNSGVLHAGVYYAPGSRKAAMCRAGKGQVEEFARQHGIPFEHSGKLTALLDGFDRHLPAGAVFARTGDAQIAAEIHQNRLQGNLADRG